MPKDLRETVLEANLELNRRGVVLLARGKVSALDRDSGLVVIKPSGVSSDEMTADDMVVVTLGNETVWGARNPSSDTKTHSAMCRAFPEIGGVAQTHSTQAVAWAQARRASPASAPLGPIIVPAKCPAPRRCRPRRLRPTTRPPPATPSSAASRGSTRSPCRWCWSPATARFPGERTPTKRCATR